LPPHFVGVLLNPTGFGEGESVRSLRVADDRAVDLTEHRFRRRSANVDPNDEFLTHRLLPAMREDRTIDKGSVAWID